MKKYFSQSRQLISYAYPIAGSMFFNIFSSVIPMLFLARLGKYELAAAALASASFVTLLTLGRGFFSAAGILISHKTGRGDPGSLAEVGAIFRNSYLLTIVVGLFVFVIMNKMPLVLPHLGQNPQLIKLSSQYFYYGGFALMVIMLSQTTLQFYTGIGFPRINILTSASSAPITILLSYGFIFGKWGLPKLALGGIMAAVLISQSGVFLALISMLAFSKHKQPFQLFSSKAFLSLTTCWDIIKLGAPISLQSGAEMIAITITTYFMGWYGADALAATQVVNQYVILFVAFYVGCSQAVAILSSKAYAQENFELIKEYAYTGLGLMSILAVALGIIALCFPVQLLNLFLQPGHIHHHQDIIHLGKAFFLIAIIMNYADSVRYILTGTYRGLHDTKTPMRAGIIGLCVISVGSSYLLGVVFQEGAIGVRIGLACGIICSTLYLSYTFLIGKLHQRLNKQQ